LSAVHAESGDPLLEKAADFGEADQPFLKWTGGESGDHEQYDGEGSTTRCEVDEAAEGNGLGRFHGQPQQGDGQCGQDDESVEPGKSIDEDACHGQGSTSGLFSSDEDCLKEIASHIADGDKVEEVAEEPEPKCVAERKGDPKGSDQPVPAYEAETHGQEEGDEGQPQQGPVERPLLQLPDLFFFEAREQPRDQEEGQNNFQRLQDQVLQVAARVWGSIEGAMLGIPGQPE
jgi:hypothetical protein